LTLELLDDRYHVLHSRHRDRGARRLDREPLADQRGGCETFTTANAAMNADGWPFQRIDYVFVRCRDDGMPTLRVADCRRVFDQPVDDVWASDHFGVLATLEPR
jgi:endonuclease/exonuclease/phosphatase family metal-dependent hydrolase